MNSEDLRRIAAALKINAPDMKPQSDLHIAGLNSHVGKLSTVLARVDESPDDVGLKQEAAAHCGAAILLLVSLAENYSLDLDQAIVAGAHELD